MARRYNSVSHFAEMYVPLYEGIYETEESVWLLEKNKSDIWFVYDMYQGVPLSLNVFGWFFFFFKQSKLTLKATFNQKLCKSNI